ncbi:putative Acidic mammalian chitinase [Hypsibius exemplaris]|uniref:Acidic mammalian chitinase n=1 Tax=Hypsibius exemplaris TaxID=2072580 RepID=A0A1W0X5E2_HYPEX|nr:putative Acidic mammalian chitinase [Hypsibius exemplaris]
MGTVPEARRAFVDSVVVQSRTWGIDGIDIDWDWEFSPNHNDLTSFLILLRDLRRAFESDAVSRNVPRLCLSATLHWTPQLASSNVSAFNSYIDLANVQAYDQAFTAYGKTLSHHAPLFKGPLGLESSSNMVSILNAWAGRGILKSKMVAGLPLFGRGWLLKTAAQHNLADPAGELIPGPEPGAWFFNEICQKIVTDKAVVVMDQNIGASYAYSDTWWTGYNNQETLATKARWAISNGYAGIYVWEISQDDFRGSCNMGKYPLLNAIRNAHPLFTAPQVKESGIVLSSASTSSPFNSGAISLSLAVFSIITKCFSFY